jgi:hypothetical protein
MHHPVLKRAAIPDRKSRLELAAVVLSELNYLINKPEN